MSAVLDLPHGIHPGFPEDLYHARVLGLASKGALDQIHRSASHYRAWVGGYSREETEALAFGRAFHACLLEPLRFDETYVVEPIFGDCRRKEPKAARDAWRADNEGKLVLSASDHKACRSMAEATRLHPLASKLLVDGDAEVTVRWQDDETGIECKGRADYYRRSKGLLVDVKTTEDASRAGFQRSIARWGYHRQAALYRQGFSAVGALVDFFVFVAVEKTPPYAIGLYTIDDDALRRGRDSVRADLDTLAHCIEHDNWPSYDESIVTLELAPWAA